MRDLSFFKKGTGDQILLGLRRPVTPLIKGIDKVCQEVLVTLLITPGFDVFSPDRGGGIRALAGIQDEAKLKSIITSIISKTSNDVKSSQRGVGLPDSEILNNIEVVKIEVLSNNSIKISIRIITEDSQKAFISFKV
jgi:hypothetical protein